MADRKALIERRPRRYGGPAGRKERILGQVAGHEINLEIEDVLDKKNKNNGLVLDLLQDCSKNWSLNSGFMVLWLSIKDVMVIKSFKPQTITN